MKATYVEIGSKCLPIFKDPKTDSGTKRSAKGLLAVQWANDTYVLKITYQKKRKKMIIF